MGADLSKPLEELSKDDLADSIVKALGEKYKGYAQEVKSNAVDGAFLKMLDADEFIETLTDLNVTNRLHQRILTKEWNAAVNYGATKSKKISEDGSCQRVSFQKGRTSTVSLGTASTWSIGRDEMIQDAFTDTVRQHPSFISFSCEDTVSGESCDTNNSLWKPRFVRVVSSKESKENPDDIAKYREISSSTSLPASIKHASEDEMKHIPGNFYDVPDSLGVQRTPVASDDMQRVAILEALGLKSLKHDDPTAVSIKQLVVSISFDFLVKFLMQRSSNTKCIPISSFRA